MSVARLARSASEVRLGAVARAVLALAMFVCVAETPAEAAEPSDGAVSAKAAPEAVEDAASADDAEAPAEEPADEPADEDATEDGPAEVFVPSENISEDISVPFPVDI